MRAPAMIDVDLVGQECLFLRASGSFDEDGIGWCASRIARLALLDFPCVALDLELVADIDEHGRRLLCRFVATLRERGQHVVLTDPADRLGLAVPPGDLHDADPMVA